MELVIEGFGAILMLFSGIFLLGYATGCRVRNKRKEHAEDECSTPTDKPVVAHPKAHPVKMELSDEVANR